MHSEYRRVIFIQSHRNSKFEVNVSGYCHKRHFVYALSHYRDIVLKLTNSSYQINVLSASNNL